MLRARPKLPLHAPLDFVIRGAAVLDGTGADAFLADVGVTGERIAAIGEPSSMEAPLCIHARGLTLAPGFIDCHSHDDDAVITSPDMRPKVSQGVTTVINGNCGLSLAPLSATRIAQLAEPLPAPLSLFSRDRAYVYPTMAAYRTASENAPCTVNVAQLIGHSTLRAAFVDDLDRAATAEEIAHMSNAIAHAMDAGCTGLSAGLAYRSSRAASTAEMIALARVAAARGGVFTIHLRDEGVRVAESVAEAILIARAAGVATILSHHKCVGRDAWGLTRQTLAQIVAARDADPALQLDLDCYPYTASSTVLMMERVSTATKTVLTHSAPFPAMAGRDLADVAREWDVGVAAAVERLSPAGAVYFNLDEDDLLRVLKFPQTMIGSDGLIGQPRPHPRLWGTFPRVLGHYVRERRILTLADAVHRMTGVPARVFGLRDRGVIREGAFADLVLFDAAQVIDRATFEAPAEVACGIERVWVNGEMVWADRAGVTRARPGRWLNRTSLNT
jgi:N-acyl-D-amino-acid deacylase